MTRPSKALRQILRPMGKKFGAGVQELKMRWPEIAGPRLAAVSTPEKLSGNPQRQTLIVRTKGSAAMLVDASSAQILERVNLVVGAGQVVAIRSKQGRMGNMSAPNSQPRQQTGCKPEQLTALDKQLADISDPDLKAALRELGLGVIGKQGDQ